MITVSEAVRDIVDHDPALKSGLAQRLMNLSQVARHIHAVVEARTRKSVQHAAIAMALSRLQSELPALDEGGSLTLADRVTVQRGLAIVTLPNVPEAHRGLLEVQRSARPEGRYVTITEGIREITLIVEEAVLDAAIEGVGVRPTRVSRGIASVSVSLTRENLRTPGVLYRLLQPLALQGINLAEVTSTTTEFHVYLVESDVMLALDSLYGAFGRSSDTRS
jgi:hypothetical protein